MNPIAGLRVSGLIADRLGAFELADQMDSLAVRLAQANGTVSDLEKLRRVYNNLAMKFNQLLRSYSTMRTQLEQAGVAVDGSAPTAPAQPISGTIDVVPPSEINVTL